MEVSRIDLMIAGAQKAGTTALKNYLGQHPAILTHDQTEFSFFANDAEFEKGFARMAQTSFPFSQKPEACRIIAKHAGLGRNKKALQRLFAHNNECVLVLILRHPAERAWSGYLMEKYAGWTDQPFSIITKSLQRFQQGEKDQWFRLFIEPGLYVQQLEQIYSVFPPQQVMLFLYETLRERPQDVCQQIFVRLSVDPSFSIRTEQRYNVSAPPRSYLLARLLLWLTYEHNPVKKTIRSMLPPAWYQSLAERVRRFNQSQKAAEPISEDVRQVLIEFYRPYNEALQQLTALPIDHWNR